MQVSLLNSSNKPFDNTSQSKLYDAHARIKKNPCCPNAILLNICRIAIAIFMVLATLGLILCFEKSWKILKADVLQLKKSDSSKPILYKSVQTISIVALPESLPPSLAPSSIPIPPPAPASLKIPPAGNPDEASIKQDMESILKYNPSWRAEMKDWQTISLQDQLWILNIFELHRFLTFSDAFPHGVFPLNKICLEDQTPNFSLKKVNKFLQERLAIEVFLESITLVNCYHPSYHARTPLMRCPKAISLLKNLIHLELSGNELTVAPDISRNIQLKKLLLNNNKIVVPPDLKKNIQLEEIDLTTNPLKTAPDVTKNSKLKKLILAGNQISDAPDLRQNPELIHLEISNNKLRLPPDICQNTQLIKLNLSQNSLTVAPVTSSNPLLQKLNLSGNELPALPDLSANTCLQELHAYANKLESVPDMSKNVMLKELWFHTNLISKMPDLSRLSHLKRLLLQENELEEFPNVSQNFELEDLYLASNHLTEVIDLSNLKKLRLLLVDENPLSANAKAKLIALKQACPKLHIQQD